MARHLHAGNEPPVVTESRCIGACDPAETIEVTLMLRRQQEQDLDALLQGLASGDPQAQPVSREAFAQRFSARPDDIANAEAFARKHQLAVVRIDPVESVVVLSGTIAQCEAAFGVKLQRFEHHTIGQYRGRTGAITLPDELHDAVTAVLGLDNRPQAHPYFRFRPPLQPARSDAAVTFTPLQIASVYNFPNSDGAGQCIGLIELGGGYQPADIEQYFSGLGLARQPTLVDINVGSGRNAPTGDPNGPDGEVALDIEIAGAIAPAATVAVYFSPNSDAGFIQAVNQAVHDTTHHPSVISISWGGPEAAWSPPSIQAFNRVLQSAAALGVTVCVAAGDSGSGDAAQGGSYVDFPASSPYVLACGGTRLDAVPGQGIRSEVVWNDGASSGGATGGGVSTVFAVPTWQQGLSATLTQGDRAEPLAKRGVPDVAGDASPLSGYQVSIDGAAAVLGGTSAVAPLWAALVARINAVAGSPAGWINPKLYRNPSALNDITQGNNGAYAASAGWDACTGLGSPDGAKVAAALGGTAAAQR